MIITQIVAASTNNTIGKDYKLLWTLPNDMRFFKNKTWGLPVIMGRKTFNSLEQRALNGRLNIVITRDKNFRAEGFIYFNNIEAAINFCKEENYNEVMIIGGGEIYKQSLPITNKIYLTRVHTTVDGDTSYPELDEEEWSLVFEENFSSDAKHAFDYSFQTWERL